MIWNSQHFTEFSRHVAIQMSKSHEVITYRQVFLIIWIIAIDQNTFEIHLSNLQNYYKSYFQYVDDAYIPDIFKQKMHQLLKYLICIILNQKLIKVNCIKWHAYGYPFPVLRMKKLSPKFDWMTRLFRKLPKWWKGTSFAKGLFTITNQISWLQSKVTETKIWLNLWLSRVKKLIW